MPIELSGVRYAYAQGSALQTQALKETSLTIRDGEFVGIMGKTGCGKTTMMQLMAGLLMPDTGRVLLDGEDIHDRAFDPGRLREKIGVVFQYPEYQLFETTVERDVAFGLKHLPLSREEKARRVCWALELVGFSFEKIRALSPMSLSGGEKRRVAIAGVLAVKPKHLLLDEPIAGLDPLGREAFLQLLQSLNAFGTTIVMISHNADVLAEYAGRILYLENGTVGMDGLPSAILPKLGLGQVCGAVQSLRERGFNVPGQIVRYDALLPELVKIAKGGGRE